MVAADVTEKAVAANKMQAIENIALTLVCFGCAAGKCVCVCVNH